MTQPADRRLLTEAAGNATYVVAARSASRRGLLGPIAVPRDSTGATGVDAELRWDYRPPAISPRGVGPDGGVYFIRFENNIWRSYDSVLTWEEGFNLTPYAVSLYAGSGTFTLTVEGSTTSPLSWASTPEQVKTALEALPVVGAGNAKVWADPQLSGARRGWLILLRGAATAKAITGTHSLVAEPAPMFVVERHKIWWLNRTSSGYCVITLAAQSPVWRDGHMAYWHTTDFAAASDVQLTLVSNLTTLTAFSRPTTIAGDTWMTVGEYVTGRTPSVPTKRFLTRDGGLTWTVIRTVTPKNTTANNHCHTSLIEPSGRIWASDGDGPNSWFGYTDDLGKTWVPVKTPPGTEVSDPGGEFQQPTTMIDFTTDGRIGVSPDRGAFTPGVWDMDADTFTTRLQYGLPGLYEMTPGNGNDAAAQYGHPMYAQSGKTAYVMFNDTGSGSKKTVIAATGDWGRSWWTVAEIPWGTGSLGAGLYGPDLNGRIYCSGTNVSGYGSGVLTAPVLEWDWQMLPSAE